MARTLTQEDLEAIAQLAPIAQDAGDLDKQAYTQFMEQNAQTGVAPMVGRAGVQAVSRGKRFLDLMKNPKGTAKKVIDAAKSRRAPSVGGKSGTYLPKEQTQLVPAGARRTVSESRELVPIGKTRSGNELIPHPTARAGATGPAPKAPPKVPGQRPQKPTDKIPRQTTGTKPGDKPDIVRPPKATTSAPTAGGPAPAAKPGRVAGMFDKFGKIGKFARYPMAGGLGYGFLVPEETKNEIGTGIDNRLSSYLETEDQNLPIGNLAAHAAQWANRVMNLPKEEPVELPQQEPQVERPSPEEDPGYFTEEEVNQMLSGYKPIYDTYEQQFRASPYGDMVDEVGNPIEPEKGLFGKALDFSGRLGNRVLNAGLAGQGIDPRYGANANALAMEEMQRLDNPVPYEAADLLARAREGDIFGDMQSQYMALQMEALKVQQMQSQGLMDEATSQAELRGIQMQQAFMEQTLERMGIDVSNIGGKPRPANLVVTDDMIQQ